MMWTTRKQKWKKSIWNRLDFSFSGDLLLVCSRRKVCEHTATAGGLVLVSDESTGVRRYSNRLNFAWYDEKRCVCARLILIRDWFPFVVPTPPALLPFFLFVWGHHMRQFGRYFCFFFIFYWSQQRLRLVVEKGPPSTCLPSYIPSGIIITVVIDNERCRCCSLLLLEVSASTSKLVSVFIVKAGRRSVKLKKHANNLVFNLGYVGMEPIWSTRQKLAV